MFLHIDLSVCAPIVSHHNSADIPQQGCSTVTSSKYHEHFSCMRIKLLITLDFLTLKQIVFDNLKSCDPETDGLLRILNLVMVFDNCKSCGHQAGGFW